MLDGLSQLRTALGNSGLAKVAVGAIAFVILLSTPIAGLDFSGEPAQLGDGTASVTVVEPSGSQLQIEPGRFGTQAVYLRIPDLVATVDSLQGQPQLVYELTVPELGMEKRETRLIQSTGRLRVGMTDQAFEAVDSGVYDGQLSVRVQSFSGGSIVLNRSVEVHAP